MKQENNPLGLEDKKYTEKEFALAIRNKFETNDFLPDEVLVNISRGYVLAPHLPLRLVHQVL